MCYFISSCFFNEIEAKINSRVYKLKTTFTVTNGPATGEVCVTISGRIFSH